MVVAAGDAHPVEEGVEMPAVAVDTVPGANCAQLKTGLLKGVV